MRTGEERRATAAVCLLQLLWTARCGAEETVTRDYSGDVFVLDPESCRAEGCDRDGRRAARLWEDSCLCQCAPTLRTFREDRKQCVRDLAECSTVAFVGPFGSEKIPLVFLPPAGHPVRPGARLSVPELCQVTSIEYLTSQGWIPLESRGEEHPFVLFRHGNKTLIKWRGSDEDRSFLQHKLVLLRLRCPSEAHSTSPEPCVAFRVGWTRAAGGAAEQKANKRNSFVIVGLCLGILGFTYVLALFVYLKLRRRPPRTRGKFPVQPEDSEAIPPRPSPQVVDAVSGEANGRGEAPEAKISDRRSSPPAARLLIRLRQAIGNAKRRLTERRRGCHVPEDGLFPASGGRKDELPDNRSRHCAAAEGGYKSRMEAVYNVPVDALSRRWPSDTYPVESVEKEGVPTVARLNKFDAFRRDLYEKILRIRQNETDDRPASERDARICRRCNVNSGYSPIPEETRKLFRAETGFSRIAVPPFPPLSEEKSIRSDGSLYRDFSVDGASSAIEKTSRKQSGTSSLSETEKNDGVPHPIEVPPSSEGRATTNDNLLREEVKTGESDETEWSRVSVPDDDSLDPDALLHLSSRVARKLSAPSVPAFEQRTEGNGRSFGRLWREVRSGLDGLRRRSETGPVPADGDNWTLKKNEGPARRLGRLVRKFSFRNEEASASLSCRRLKAEHSPAPFRIDDELPNTDPVLTVPAEGNDNSKKCEESVGLPEEDHPSSENTKPEAKTEDVVEEEPERGESQKTDLTEVESMSSDGSKSDVLQEDDRRSGSGGGCLTPDSDVPSPSSSSNMTEDSLDARCRRSPASRSLRRRSGAVAAAGRSGRGFDASRHFRNVGWRHVCRDAERRDGCAADKRKDDASSGSVRDPRERRGRGAKEGTRLGSSEDERSTESCRRRREIKRRRVSGEAGKREGDRRAHHRRRKAGRRPESVPDRRREVPSGVKDVDRASSTA
ncbi:uncharacterized protein [Centruroides vittatus]|uniref:uncharacterized protein n=1 Tax=Centruroides vittatus TaxID=120091 RepID=UPI00350FC014